MGYYTSYTLKCDNYEIISQLREENDHAKYALDNNGEPRDDCKWYEHEKDLRIFSKKHPDVLFILEGEGEETGDIWKEYYKNGKMQQVVAKIVFDSFNDNLLR